MADGSGMAVLARHHDADDCDSHSDQHHRQRRRFIGMPSINF
jgi:hypothetical protein